MMRRGMTLIELLIVLLIIAILASIFGLRMLDATRAAHMAALRADLRTLAVMEYVFLVDNHRYGTLEELTDFRATQNVEVTMAWTDEAGFAATGTHLRVPGSLCGIFVGPAPTGAAAPAVEAGVVTCE
jgi:prepilin-type N-terminal cleavage/methylation domain-containing protein